MRSVAARLVFASLTCLSVAFGGGANMAFAGQLPRMSPRVRMVARGELPASVIGDPVTRGARALVTIRLQGGAPRLRTLGIAARALSPSVAGAELDAAALAKLAATPFDDEVVIEERRILRPMLDQANYVVKANLARAQSGFTGTGAYVGVVDTGVDFRHADLRNADGTTRIDALIDMSVPADGRHTDLGDYGGDIWLADEIDAQLAADAAGTMPTTVITESDTNGHGTHVTSIATSDGLATGNGLPSGRYIGMAPGARLLVAQASGMDGSFTDLNVLAACSFLIARAKAAGLPLVVNISLGGDGGAHDGTSNLEMSLDELFPTSTPGLALVVAAGNDGQSDLHGSGWALAGDTELSILTGEDPTSSAALELWYRGSVEVAVEGPSGARTGFVPVGGSLDQVLPKDGEVTIDNADAMEQQGAESSAGIIITPAEPIGLAPTSSSSTWRLVVRGTAVRYDAWLIDSPGGRFLDHVDVDDKLNTPASAASAISVGAMVERLSWPGIGMLVTQPGTLGVPASFSSPGPTNDGRFAPDVVAPGEFVVAAMSSNATPDMPESVFYTGEDPSPLQADDGVHGVLQGTSQATPMVTGAIALLFAASPQLTSDQVREILRSTASPVADTNAGFSPRAGAGLLNVAAAMSFVSGTRGGPASAALSGVGVVRDVLPPETSETTLVTVTARDAAGVSLGGGHVVTIEMSAGQPMGDVIDHGAGRYDRLFVAQAAQGAVGVVTATVDGVQLASQPRVFFVASPAEIGGPKSASSQGCDASTGIGARGGWWLAFFACGMALLRARRRRAIGAAVLLLGVVSTVACDDSAASHALAPFSLSIVIGDGRTCLDADIATVSIAPKGKQRVTMPCASVEFPASSPVGSLTVVGSTPVYGETPFGTQTYAGAFDVPADGGTTEVVTIFPLASN